MLVTLDYIKEINNYVPKDTREEQDKKVILECIDLFPHNILLRDNEIAHITSSGLILNNSLSKVLMIHHNIRNTWAWTGGHADGDPDLLAVATREALEETGVCVTPVSTNIASLDILTVPRHFKNNNYVNSHLHLSAAYLFTADDTEQLTINPDENSGVEWFPIEKITEELFTDRDVYLYTKLINQAKILLGLHTRHSDYVNI